MPDTHSKYYLQSLAKGIQVLKVISQSSKPIGITEIARKLNTNNATVSRICYTLSYLGYITKDIQKRWRLTPKVLVFGYAAINSQGWLQTAQHYLEELSERTGETTNLSVMEGGDIIYVCRVDTRRILPYDIRLGTTLPVHCTSMGKVLLAFRPEEKIQDVVGAIDFVALTHNTITSKDAYLKELETVRTKGYAVNDEELSVGLRSVAAPVLDSQGWSMAALNIAVSTTRMSRDQLESEMVPLLLNTAKDIESTMSFLDQRELSAQSADKEL
ncbi:MAG: IclR family transcriptional regulator C-terminal domain-containing protein [Desulfovermiculus sp.]|nr:IclR family transcriptional regulator C-terminal domain-containing protein [Desulfovermiculus sp.]